MAFFDWLARLFGSKKPDTSRPKKNTSGRPTRSLEDVLMDLTDQPDSELALQAVLDRLNLDLKVDPEVLEQRAAERRKGAVGKFRQTWVNQIANERVQPLQYSKPRSLLEVTKILEHALATNLRVKPAGSGHSYSDVATTNDIFIDTHDLNQVADAAKPIAGQLAQEDLKPDWRKDAMKSRWKSLDGLDEILVDSSMEDIMKVREIAEGNTQLFETESGITIHDLNIALKNADLGMPNMGGYDGQTLIGAISTSTHGSGIELGPFPDIIKSLVIATTGKLTNGNIVSGQPHDEINYYRIEPGDGITDPAQYAAHQANYNVNGRDIILVQDDDIFRAVQVTMGTMGIIYSVVIQVMQTYYLTETRRLTTLDKLLENLQPDPTDPEHMPDILRRYRNFGAMVSPYPMKDGKVIEMDPNEPPETYYKYFSAVELLRNITPKPHRMDNHDANTRPRNIITGILGRFKISFEATKVLVNNVPRVAPKIVEGGLKSLADDNYVQVYDKIYMTGVNGQAGFATEIGFPVEAADGKWTVEHLTNAIDEVNRICQSNRLNGDQYQTSPYAVRFVKKTDAHMSMMQGINTTMVELDMLTGTYAGEEVVNRQQQHLYKLGGRPHWGLEFSQLTGNHDLMTTMYPEYPKWLAVYQQLNAKGTFDNDTTRRLGFSGEDYQRNDAPPPAPAVADSNKDKAEKMHGATASATTNDEVVIPYRHWPKR